LTRVVAVSIMPFMAGNIGSTAPAESVTVVCGVCGWDAGQSLHDAREMMYGLRERFTYRECVACGCLELLDVPSDLSPYYPSDYVSFSVDASSWKPAPRWRAFLKRRYTRYKLTGSDAIGALAAKRFPHWTIPEWLRHVDVDRDASILDVGTGTGAALHALNELGYTSLTGVDPFIPNDLRYPNGVVVYKRTIYETEGPFDVVLASHVFEHMAAPEESLGQLARLLRVGSTLVMSIPVSQSALWARYGVNWVGLDAPRHLFLHNEKTIGLLADRVGLVVDRVVYNTTTWNFTASEGYVRDIPLHEQKPEEFLTKIEMDAFAVEVEKVNAAGTGDQATFYLRKP